MNQCQANKKSWDGQLNLRCTVAARVDINKKKLCLRHAQQEALALAFELKKAKEIVIPIVLKDIKAPIEVFKERETNE